MPRIKMIRNSFGKRIEYFKVMKQPVRDGKQVQQNDPP